MTSSDNTWRRIKVAVVIPRYDLVGGAEGYARELSERLAVRPPFEIHVLANRWRDSKSPVRFHKVPIVPFPRFIRPISFAVAVQRTLKKDHYDLVHSHERIFSPDLFTVHGLPHKTWVKEARRKRMSLFDRSTAWVEGRGLRSATSPVVMPVSGLVKEEYLKRYDIPESRIHVIHPGVSEELFSGLKPSQCRLEIRRQYGISHDDIVVLFVGMNFEIKRLDLIIEGVSRLAKETGGRSRLRILVVGKGNIKKYEALARKLGLGERIAFAGVTREVAKYYLASDIFALPSEFDAFPLVTLEAMAGGLPVIISGHVGTKDIIESGLNGFVLEDRPSAESFSKCLAFLLDDERRMKMGERAKMVAQRYTWAETANRVSELYAQLGRSGREPMGTRGAR